VFVRTIGVSNTWL